MPGLRHAAMLEVNEFLVLDYIRGRGSATRPQIARDLGLSASSVSRIVGRLLRSGIVTEEAGPREAPGRPPSRIVFNQRAGAVIGVDLGGTKCHAALADLGGEILAERLRPTHGETDPYGTLLGAIADLREEARRRDLPVLAAAVGVPAILDPASGVAVCGPNVQWEGFPIVSRLARDLDIPVVVENDVNLAALAQAWRGDGRRVRDFVTISIGTGIGAAVVANGRLVKGHHNAAGEVGYLTLAADQLDQPLRGGVGDFEDRASGPAIARRARELLASTSAPSLLRQGEATPARVFAAAGEGDELARRIVGEVLDAVSLALVAIAAVVDPQRIIIDGGVGRSLAPYLDHLRRRLQARLWSAPELVISSLGADATVLGAIAAALQILRRSAAPASLFGIFEMGGSDGIDRHAGLVLQRASPLSLSTEPA
jgi:glucokinase